MPKANTQPFNIDLVNDILKRLGLDPDVESITNTRDSVRHFMEAEPKGEFPDPDDGNQHLQELKDAIEDRNWDTAAQAGQKIEEILRFTEDKELTHALETTKKAVQNNNHNIALDAVKHFIELYNNPDTSQIAMAKIADISPVTLTDLPDNEISSLHWRVHQLWGKNFADTRKERAGNLVREDLWNTHEMIAEEMERRFMDHNSPVPRRKADDPFPGLEGLPDDLSDEDLLDLHNRLHHLWDQYFADTFRQHARNFSRQDLDELHDALIGEMKRRDMEHDSPLPERKANATALRDTSLNLPMKLTVVPSFVSLVGSTATNGPDQEDNQTSSDVDILIRAERDENKFLIQDDNVYLPIRKALDPDKEGRLHFIGNPQGPHGDHIPLYDLVLIRRAGRRDLQLATNADALIKIDLGCSRNKPEGYIGIDIRGWSDADIMYDLEEGIPLPDNYADIIRAHHVLEHLSDPRFIMYEIWRALKPDGILDFEVPSTRGEGAFAHPDHKSYWNKTSFYFYTEDHLIEEASITCKFDIIKINEEVGPEARTLNVFGQLRKVAPEPPIQLALAVLPWYTGPLPKPAMKFHTEFFSIDELWNKWAKKRIDDGLMVEEKLNGFRAMAQKKGDQIRINLLSEDRTNVADRFPDLVTALKGISGDFILDGDLGVEQDGHRWPRIKLMTLAADQPDLPEDAHVVFTAFDILHHDNTDYTQHPLSQRRPALESPIRSAASDSLATSEAEQASSRSALEKAGRRLAGKDMSEGIVVKELDSPYPKSKSTSNWAKVKHTVEIKGIVLKAKENKAGTYNFRAGLLPGNNEHPNVTKLDGTEYVDLGFSFNAPFKAEVGDIVTFRVEEIILEEDGELGWLGALPLDIDQDREDPYTVPQVIDLAQRGRILQDATLARSQQADTPQDEGDTRAEHAKAFWAKHWHESFPKDGKGEWVYQHHWRGLSEEQSTWPEDRLLDTDHSVHGDLRLSFGKALWGFTCFLGRTDDAQQRDLPDLPADDALEGKFKLHQPEAWLTIARDEPFIAEPGDVGSTSKSFSKFFEIDHGTYEVGVWHKRFLEVFLDGGKIKGRYIITFAPIGDSRKWLIRRPDDQTPFAESHAREEVVKDRSAKGDDFLVWSKPGAQPELIEL